MGWYYVFCGGLLEIGFTTHALHGRIQECSWTLGFLVCIAASMFCLEAATKTVPIGTAYAVWTGIGALGTVVVGMIWYHEPANLLRMLLLITLIGAVAGLKLTAGH